MNFFSRVINKIRKTVFNKYYRPKYLKAYKLQIKNDEISIICNNCFAGMLYHDMGLKFMSPTINLYFEMPDYIDFLENLTYYINCEITFGGTIGDGVVGIIDGKIKLYAIHYSTFDELKTKWNERKKRINYEKLYIIGVYRDGCTEELARRFCALPYKNKVFLSHKKINCENNDCIVQVNCGKKATEVPSADKMVSCKMRAYNEAFDFFSWIREN